MKLHLPQFLFAALLATQSFAPVHADIKPDGADYYKINNGDGTYKAEAHIDAEFKPKYEAFKHAGGVYVDFLAENPDATEIIRDVDIEMTDGRIEGTLAAGNFRALPVSGDVNISVTGGYVANLLGGNNTTTDLVKYFPENFSAKIDSINITVGGNAEVGSIRGDSTIGIEVGGIELEEFIKKYSTTGDITITVKDSAKVGTINGVRQNNYGEDRNLTINIEGGTIENIDATTEGKGTASNTTIRLLGGSVTGNINGGERDKISGTRTLYVGTESTAIDAYVNAYSNFDQIVISRGSSLNATEENNLFSIANHSYSVAEENRTTAVVTTSGNVSIENAITLNLNIPVTLSSGRYMLIDAREGTVDTTNWNEKNVTVASTGTKVSYDDLAWIDSILYVYLLNEDTMNMLSGNWGIFKSSQAFVNTLWGKRTNSRELQPDEEVDEKGCPLDSSKPASCTLAWGTVYGQSARIGGVGADYSLYGGALGIEHHSMASGSSIGLAFGYDWGKVSPFYHNSIDQETAHMALYGRLGEWTVGKKGSIAFDWSAAVGESTSESDALTTDWEQKHMQIDARISYLHRLNAKATASVFAGIQYFAAEDAKVERVKISSMQNLRTEIGAGITYKATPKTTVWGEASLYNDAMRHNPYIRLEDREYHGTNPGRLGGSVSVGAGYQLSENWSLQGNYSFDAADDSTEHNMNVGATYRF